MAKIALQFICCDATFLNGSNLKISGLLYFVNQNLPVVNVSSRKLTTSPWAVPDAILSVWSILCIFCFENVQVRKGFPTDHVPTMCSKAMGYIL